MKVSDVRGKAVAIGEDAVAIVTVHPSFLLRLTDREEARRQRTQFTADLRRAQELLIGDGSRGRKAASSLSRAALDTRA